MSGKRVSVVTLGVQDLKRTKKFFASLFDWHPNAKDHEAIIFYNMGGWILALYPRGALAEDIAISAEGSGFQGMTLAHNVRTKEEVAPILQKAESLGAKIIKPAQDVFWGGHSGYFQDLDGFYWEVAHNPFTAINADGSPQVKD